MDPLRNADCFRAGAFPKKYFEIPVSSHPVRNPLSGRADREHPPTCFFRSNVNMDNDSIVPGISGWYCSIEVSSSYDPVAGDISYQQPVF